MKSNDKKTLLCCKYPAIFTEKLLMMVNDYNTTREKSCPWVMVVLFYNLTLWSKTIWSLKHKEDVSKFSSYNFVWNLARALSHVLRRKLNGLTSMMQLKMKMFLRIVLKVPKQVSNIENRYQWTDKREK